MGGIRGSRQTRAVLVVLGVLPFALITALVSAEWGPLMRLDQSLVDVFHDYGVARPGWVEFWRVLGADVLPWSSRAVIIVLAAYLWRRKAKLLTGWLLATMAAEFCLVQLVKQVVDRPRPVEQLVELQTPAYVSGHATAAFVMAGAIGVVLPSVRAWRKRVWLPVATVCGLVAFLASLDRIVLGVHYLSDVIGAWALGFAILTSTTAGFGLRSRRRAQTTRADSFEVGAIRPRAAVIVNPTKVGDGPAFRRKVTRALDARGYTETLWLETAWNDPGNAMAKHAVEEGVDLVLVAGGDGTVRVVCAQLAHTGIPVGVVPAGTGNLLARNLGIPLDMDDALNQLLDGQNRRIDLVRVDGDGLETDRFAVMAGLGLDAAIISDAPNELKKRLGWTAYVVSAARNINHPSVRVKIKIDDEPARERRVRTVVIGNVGMLQANIPLLPDARPDDGLIDIIVIAPRRVTQWPRLIVRVMARQKKTDLYLERFTAERVEITASDYVRRQLDGDGIGSGRGINAEVEPGALVVRVPIP